MKSRTKKVIVFLQHLPRASTTGDQYLLNIGTNDLFVTIVPESKQVITSL